MHNDFGVGIFDPPGVLTTTTQTPVQISIPTSVWINIYILYILVLLAIICVSTVIKKLFDFQIFRREDFELTPLLNNV